MQSQPQPISAIRLAMALSGFIAVVGQIVLMRELIVVFNGNEISLGIMLATWLFWSAVGSILTSRFVAGAGNPSRAVAVFECLIGVTLIPTIWILRAAKTFFQTVPGELVGPAPMLLTSLACLSVFCCLCGGMFVVVSRTYQQEYGVVSRVATSAAFLWEAAGSAAGGIVASVVLLPYLGSFQIALVVAVLNLFTAALLCFGTGRKPAVTAAVVVTLLGSVVWFYVAPSWLESSQVRQWRGLRVVAARDSIYGNLSVTETGNLRSIYDNGVIVGTAPDASAAEEAVHYALLEHPAPAHVLLIGGAATGAIAEALKHPTIERLDYVELDPTLIDLLHKFFAPQLTSWFSNPRVRIHYADGRYYMKTTDVKFDVIVLNLPDPQTAQLNRFYTAEFFRAARNHLAVGGVLALELRSSEDYISPNLAEFLRCIHHTLRQAFPYVVAIPGETIHFFAALKPDVLTDDPKVLIARLESRHIATQYVREYFIPFRMAPDRMTEIRELLQTSPTTPVNRDFAPIAYYFDVVLWSGQFKSGYARLFQSAASIGFSRIVESTVVILLLVALVVAYLPTAETGRRLSAAYCVAATGFTLMTLQIFLLLAFQALYGYLYHRLAMLIAMFMAGIAFGNWLAIRRAGHSTPLRALAGTQVSLAIAAPALMFLISALAKTSSALPLAAHAVFPLLAAGCGALGGYQFPIATGIYLGNARATGLGALYAIDLLGGCAGSLLLSSYLIPVFGFWRTAWLSAAMNLVPALLAARASWRVSPA